MRDYWGVFALATESYFESTLHMCVPYLVVSFGKTTPAQWPVQRIKGIERERVSHTSHELGHEIQRLFNLKADLNVKQSACWGLVYDVFTPLNERICFVVIRHPSINWKLNEIPHV